MTRISDCSTTTSSKLYLSELEHLLSFNHYQNLKNFRLHSNLSKKFFFAFFPAEFFLESLNETPTRDLCHLRPFAGLFHYTAYIGQVRSHKCNVYALGFRIFSQLTFRISWSCNF